MPPAAQPAEDARSRPRRCWPRSRRPRRSSRRGSRPPPAAGWSRSKITGDLRLESLTIDPDAVDPEDVEMLQDMVVAAVNEALRSAEELQQRELGDLGGGGFDPMSALDPRAGRPRRRSAAGRPGGLPGGGGAALNRPRAAAAQEASSSMLGAARSSASSPSWPAARHRQPHRAAARLPHPARLPGGRARARRRDPRGQGEDRALRGLLQPRRGAALHDLPGRAPRPDVDLRRRGAGRRDPDRAHARVPRPLPRARRRAVADRRRRPRGPADRRALRPRSDGEVREVVLATNPTTTGEATALHIAERAARPRARRRRHPARQRPAGRRRPRVRRRGHARPGVRRAPGRGSVSVPSTGRRDEVRRHLRRRRRAHQARRPADRRARARRATASSPCSPRAARRPTS